MNTFSVGPVSITVKKEMRTRRIPHSGNARMHWTERSRWNKAWREQTGLLALTQRPSAPYPKASARITLFTVKLLDTDNAYAAVKPIVDGLKNILIVDDAPDKLVLGVDQFQVLRKADEGVIVKVSPVI